MEQRAQNSGTTTGAPIEVRVENIAQLFDTLDPFPFPERDLDKDAEEYIVGWARDLPRHQPIVILIHLPAGELDTQDATAVSAAMKRYFDYRAGAVTRDLRELFRIGRLSFVIGLAVLGLCLSASQFIARQLGTAPFARFLEESLIIVGWVANWKPIEILLYDWLPLTRRRNLYRRLTQARVELKSF